MWKKIKNFLKRFLPASAQTFHAQMENLLQELKALRDNSRKVQEVIGKTNMRIDRLVEENNMRNVRVDKIAEETNMRIDRLVEENDMRNVRVDKIAEETNMRIDRLVEENNMRNVRVDKITEETNMRIDRLVEENNAHMGKAANEYHALNVQANNTRQQILNIATKINTLETKYLKIQPQPRLSYFVLNILDHCNLRCKGCDHFAAIAEKRFVPLENIVNDLRQISKITEKMVTRIGIMGGEPLLHPYLPEILTAARKEFPNTLIQLVTNGILLLQQDDVFWSTCCANEIVIVVTKYPIELNYDKIVHVAQEKNVEFEYYGKTGEETKTLYKMPMDILGRQNAQLSFWNCYHGNSLPLLMEGKFYPCTVAPNATHFNKKFDTKMELGKGDYIDIYSINILAELLLFLSTPKPFCRYCKTTERSWGHVWERSRQEMSEWT